MFSWISPKAKCASIAEMSVFIVHGVCVSIQMFDNAGACRETAMANIVREALQYSSIFYVAGNVSALAEMAAEALLQALWMC